MDKLRIRNWDKWQSYRKDRGQPPWIKIHREVMRNPDWVALTDSQRGQLVSIWLLAADHNGVIPASPEIIMKLCYMEKRPDIKLFIDHGFIENDAKVTPTRRQHDQPDTEAETETEVDIMSGKPDVPPKVNGYKQDAVKLIKVLNNLTGRHFRENGEASIQLIVARLKSGIHVDHLHKMIGHKVRQWKNDDKMKGYLRPSTLFNKEKCEQYIGEVDFDYENL